MATNYLKDWTKRADPKSGGFHLSHKSGTHTISFLPNKEKGGYDIKHSGKLVGHHANAAGALKHAVGYFKQNYNKEAPANVNFSSSSSAKSVTPVTRVAKAETVHPKKTDYFRKKLQEVKGVHQPYMEQGESFAGEMSRQAQSQSSPVHADMARKLHGQKLKELIGIKPNLPKAEMTPHTKGNKYQSPAEGTSSIDEQRHAGIKGVNSPMDSVGSSAKTKSPHVLKEIKSIKPNLPKSELNKAKIDEGKSVVTKINDRNGRHFRDRLQNLKGQFAKESIHNKAQAAAPEIEFERKPHTKESVKANALSTHAANMKHLKETKPNLPKSELNKADILPKLKANKAKNIAEAKSWSKEDAQEMHDTYHKAIQAVDAKHHPVLKEKITQLEEAHPHLKKKS